MRTRRKARGWCPTRSQVPHPFCSGADLLARTKETGLPISGVMLANELVQAGRGRDQGGAVRGSGR